MSPVELALRDYRSILPEPWTPLPTGPTAPDEVRKWKRSSFLNKQTRKKLTVWIQRSVRVAVETYWRLPTFRDHAAWSVRNLAPGVDTPERRLVETVDQALRGYASLLIEFANTASVAAELAKIPLEKYVTKETVTVGQPSSESSPARNRTRTAYAPLDKVHEEKGLVESIARREWTDLVCVEDYFRPLGGFRGDYQNVQFVRGAKGGRKGPRFVAADGSFVIALNPELPPIGDYVRRCLFRRIETYLDELGRFRSRCLGTPAASKRAVAAIRRAEETKWSELSQAVEALRAAVDSGEPARVRESCTVLAQLYLAYAARSNANWLALPDFVVGDGREYVRGRVEVVDTSSFFDRVAVALKDLSTLYDGTPSEVSDRDKAVAAGGLVLTDNPPTAYWDGQPLDVEWSRHRLSWYLLWRLAEKAKTGQAVGQADLYEGVASEGTMATNMHRLRRLKLGTLKKHLIRGPENGTYRLDLLKNRITIVGSRPRLRRRKVG